MSFPKYIAKFPNIMYNFRKRILPGGMCLNNTPFPQSPSERQKKTTKYTMD